MILNELNKNVRDTYTSNNSDTLMVIHCFDRLIGIKLDDQEIFCYMFTNDSKFRESFLNDTKKSEEQVTMFITGDITDFKNDDEEELYNYILDSIYGLNEETIGEFGTEGQKLTIRRLTHDIGDGFIIGLPFDSFGGGDGLRGVGKHEEYETDIYEYIEKLKDFRSSAHELLQEHKFDCKFGDVKLYVVQDDCSCCS